MSMNTRAYVRRWAVLLGSFFVGAVVFVPSDALASPGAFVLSNETPVCDQASPVGPAIRLNWGDSAGAVSYDVYRNSSLYVHVLVTDRTFYNSANITAGNTYTYFIRAKDADGVITDSNTISVSIDTNICTPQSIPLAPSDVAASATSLTSITLMWHDNATNETGFRIERSVSGGAYSFLTNMPSISGSGGVGFYRDRGLESNAQYCYRARAYNASGDSVSAVDSCAVAGQNIVLPVLNGLTAVASSTHSIYLSWIALAGWAPGDYSIARCSGVVCENFESIKIVYLSDHDGATYDDSGLVAGTTYRYRISLVDRSSQEELARSETVSVATNSVDDGTSITYYFGGTLNESFGSLVAGTPFTGLLNYSLNQPDLDRRYSSNSLYRGQYHYNALSITIGGMTVTDNGTGNSYVYDYGTYDKNTQGTYPADVFSVSTSNVSGNLGGLPLRPAAGIILDLSDYAGTVWSSTALPGAGLTMENLTAGNGTFIQLQGVLTENFPAVSARGSIYALDNDEAKAAIRKFSLNNRVHVLGGPIDVQRMDITPDGRVNMSPQGMGQEADASGTVVGGPIQYNNHWWWNIDYDQGIDGWSEEDNLAEGTGSAVNHAPTLAFLDSGDFSNGVNPDSGQKNTEFTFKVIYTDADNDAPEDVTLHYKASHWADWSYRTMTKDQDGTGDLYDGKFNNGEIFTFSGIFDQEDAYEYYFTTDDGHGGQYQIPKEANVFTVEPLPSYDIMVDGKIYHVRYKLSQNSATIEPFQGERWFFDENWRQAQVDLDVAEKLAKTAFIYESIPYYERHLHADYQTVQDAISAIWQVTASQAAEKCLVSGPLAIVSTVVGGSVTQRAIETCFNNQLGSLETDLSKQLLTAYAYKGLLELKQSYDSIFLDIALSQIPKPPSVLPILDNQTAQLIYDEYYNQIGLRSSALIPMISELQEWDNSHWQNASEVIQSIGSDIVGLLVPSTTDEILRTTSVSYLEIVGSSGVGRYIFENIANIDHINKWSSLGVSMLDTFNAFLNSHQDIADNYNLHRRWVLSKEVLINCLANSIVLKQTSVVCPGSFYSGHIGSPGELRIYDSEGRLTGVKDGHLTNEIPGSWYSDGQFFLTDVQNNYYFSFFGTESGRYNLIINQVINGELRRVGINELPILPDEIHDYRIDWGGLPHETPNKVELSIHKSGNGTSEKTIEIGDNFSDTTPPTTTLSPSGNLGNNNWYTSDVSVALNATDNEGGVGVKETQYSLGNGATWNTYSDPITLSDEGTHTIQFYSEDWFGNKEDEQTKEIKIDKTAPEITLNVPEDGKQYILNSLVNADWSAEDAVSGLDTATGTVESGKPIDTGTVGEHAFTVTATDNAGNSDTGTVSYNAIYQFGGFQSPLTDSKVLNAKGAIPVKFKLADANGSVISTARATVRIDGKDAVSSGGSNDGNVFRYDEVDKQYIFNLSMKDMNLGSGPHKLEVQLDDGATYSQSITTK